jgi:hypothetical protein
VKNYAQFNIIIVDFIRIVIIFIKYNTFYFTYRDFSQILPSCLLFIAESGKYHPVVVLLHNHEWLKKISKTTPKTNPSEHYKHFRKAIAFPFRKLELCRHCRFRAGSFSGLSTRIQVLAHMPC